MPLLGRLPTQPGSTGISLKGQERTVISHSRVEETSRLPQGFSGGARVALNPLGAVRIVSREYQQGQNK